MCSKPNPWQPWGICPWAPLCCTWTHERQCEKKLMNRGRGGRDASKVYCNRLEAMMLRYELTVSCCYRNCFWCLHLLKGEVFFCVFQSLYPWFVKLKIKAMKRYKWMNKWINKYINNLSLSNTTCYSSSEPYLRNLHLNSFSCLE